MAACMHHSLIRQLVQLHFSGILKPAVVRFHIECAFGQHFSFQSAKHQSPRNLCAIARCCRPHAAAVALRLCVRRGVHEGCATPSAFCPGRSRGSKTSATICCCLASRLFYNRSHRAAHCACAIDDHRISRSSGGRSCSSSRAISPPHSAGPHSFCISVPIFDEDFLLHFVIGF